MDVSYGDLTYRFTDLSLERVCSRWPAASPVMRSLNVEAISFSFSLSFFLLIFGLFFLDDGKAETPFFLFPRRLFYGADTTKRWR